MAHELLAEPLISWRNASRKRGATTLPGALSLLADGSLSDFPGVRVHQLDPWCMFLTQLAAIALRRARRSDPRMSEEAWRSLLLDLTGTESEPWNLVVDDLSKPAFFQPPVPEGDTDRWSTCDHPDDLDVLVTAKNHDVKKGLVQADELEAWVYALCTLQTMQGYPGRGYTRIARMNGGYGNRPRLGLAADQALASRFRRDVAVLLDSWPDLLRRGYSDRGVALAWTEPWDGRHSLAMHELSPHFVEVCWRVRCQPLAKGVSCAYTTTAARRCLPEIEGGDVGDPWIPIERASRNALTVGSNGLDYKLLSKVLFDGDYEIARAQTPREGDGDPVYFIASALARGQGKTEGLHQRILPMAGDLRRRLGDPHERAALGRRSLVRVGRTATMRRKVLYPAFKQLAAGGPVVADGLDQRVDGMFFEHLAATLPMPEDAASVAFEVRLAELAWQELQRAIERSAAGDARRLKAISDAERMFEVCLRKHFPDAAKVRAEESWA